jgi:peptidoglycan/xylan/chitin deacetylase (PgdA/CDA1 family)
MPRAKHLPEQILRREKQGASIARSQWAENWSMKAETSAGEKKLLLMSIVLVILTWGCSLLNATGPTKNDRSRQAVPGTVTPFGEVVRGVKGRHQIALTFDAGANAECFDDLIAALEAARVHSTFFITGNFAQRHEQCAKAIVKHGHEIGNHTWSHADLTKQSDENVREEIVRGETLLTEISGQSPRPRFRAPFGERNDRVLRIAANLGYRSIYWTLDSLDSVEPRKTAPFLIGRVTNKTDADLDGAIVLMHVGEKSTADALPVIIADLQGRGFELVTVSTLLQPAR